MKEFWHNVLLVSPQSLLGSYDGVMEDSSVLLQSSLASAAGVASHWMLTCLKSKLIID